MTFASGATPSFSSVPSRDRPSRLLSPSCFAKRTRPARMEFYAGRVRKNVTVPGMNLDYGNAQQRFLFSPGYVGGRASGQATDVNESARERVFS